MKLYVWEGVLTSWQAGICFAFASNVEEARRMVHEKCNKEWKRPKGHRSAAITEALAGRPSVYKKPVGFYMWGND